MLTFNNKILTVSNKGLEVSAGPTPPTPTTTLLYEQAVQNYYTTNGMVTIMSGRTWDTDKNFICYKINLKINGDTKGSGNTAARGVFVKQSYGEGNLRYIKCGRLVADIDNMAQYGTYAVKNTSFVTSYGVGSSTAGTAGVLFYEDWDDPAFRAEPNVTATDAVTYKWVFDIAQHKAYCYIGTAQVCVIDFGTYTPYTWDLSTEYGSAEYQCALSADCGIQVYACDSLAEAEGV